MEAIGSSLLSGLEKIILVVVFLAIAIAMLPTSPFTTFLNWLDNQDLSFLKYFSYFLPIVKMVELSVAWLASVAVIYTVKIIMRFSGLIDS